MGGAGGVDRAPISLDLNAYFQCNNHTLLLKEYKRYRSSEIRD